MGSALQKRFQLHGWIGQCLGRGCCLLADQHFGELHVARDGIARPDARRADEAARVVEMEDHEGLFAQSAAARSSTPSAGLPAICSERSYWSDQNHGTAR